MSDLELNDFVDFGDPTELAFGGISDARWERVRIDIDVRDVMDVLHGVRSSPCSCPFHGRDSKPSFYFFLENNTCFCFGCPDGEGYWDAIKIVATTLECNRVKALKWLEREFHLPPIDGDTSIEEQDVTDLDAEDEADDTPAVTAEDLQEPYIQHARGLVRHAPAEEAAGVAYDLLEHLFTGLHYNDPRPLARVLGEELVSHIVRSKS